MYDLISIGTVSIDLYYKGESLTFEDGRFQLAVGGKYFADHFYESLGGGATNVAIGARKHGVTTAVLAKIGNNPFKKIILEKLADTNVSHSLCEIVDDYWNISSILLTESGERTVINYRSPDKHLVDTEDEFRKLSHAKAVYMANLAEISFMERLNVLSRLNEQGVITAVNLGIKDCRREKDQIERLIKKTRILIVNGYEFAEMVKVPYEKLNFKQNLGAFFLPYMKESIIIITEGAKGSYGYFNGEMHHQIAIEPPKIVDTTGAGDGFSAGFLAEYLKSYNPKKAMEKGAEHAAKILSKIGAN